MDYYKKKNSIALAFIGTLILFVFYLYYVYLGENIVVTMHDQLDSDVTYLVLKSQNLSSIFQTRFPQFMDGNAEVTVSSFGSLVFYLIMPSVYAFITNMFFVRILSYLSMFFLLRYYGVEPLFSYLVAMTFVFLPFYSVYGLSVMGIPLVWLSVKQLENGKMYGLVGIAVYGLFSSLFCVGFVVLFILFIRVIVLLKMKRRVGFECLAIIELIIIYTMTNYSVLLSLFLTDNGYTSHKSAYHLSPDGSIFNSFLDMCINGQYHAESLHKYIIVVVVFSVALSLIYYGTKRLENVIQFKQIIFLLSALTIICLFYAVFHSKFGVNVWEGLFAGTSLLGVQIDRFYWLNPALWYVSFGLAISLVYDIMIMRNRTMGIVLALVLWAFPSFYVVYNSDLLLNLRCDLNNYKASNTWAKEYDYDLFSEIGEFIGKDKSEYRVVSFCIEPNVALYNGFYCLDGYSNNYDIEYKEQFGKMINGELVKNEDLYRYYWEWGNRCYMFSSDYCWNRYIGKDQGISVDLDIDKNALKDLGCNYVLSGVKISNANDLDLENLGYFENEDSYYGIFLYQVVN